MSTPMRIVNRLLHPAGLTDLTPPTTTPASARPAPHRPAPVRRRTAHRSWPVLLLAAPAFVAIWSGWVGLGTLTGFGTVHPLPGIWDTATIDTAITLPIGVETYAAYALRIWLSHTAEGAAARFAKWSALGSLILGAAGQVAYHLMVAAGITHAPWQITALVACLPVAVLGMGAALAHLVTDQPAPDPAGDQITAQDTPQDAPQVPESVTDQPADQPAEQSAVPAAGDTRVDVTDEPAPRPARRRPAGTRKATSTAQKVIRLRERHPDWTVGQIAERVGVADRTVRRHLNTPGTPPADTGTAGDVAA